MAENSTPHILNVRVYYEDTDAGGIVYHANYLKFAERARTEMIRELGVESSRQMDAEGIVFAVHHCSVDYLRPARLDETLEVHSRIAKVGGASVHFEQNVRRADEDVVRMKIRVVCMDANGRSARIPKGVRALLVDKTDS